MKRNLYIALPALCGFTFLVWLSACARLSYDDVLFAACFKTRSFLGAFDFLYRTHAFRWTTFLFEDLVLGLVPGQYYPISIPAFFLLFYSLWTYQLHRLIKNLLEKFFGTGISTIQSLGFGAVLITLFYFSASQAVESFTSMIIVTDRLLPLLFITMACNLFLSEKKFMAYLGLFFCAFLLAGTAENVTITLLGGLVLFLFYQKAVLKADLSKKVAFFTVVLVGFFALENLSPGRAARLYVERTFHFTCDTDGMYCPNTLGDFLGRFFIGRQLFVFVFAALIYFFVDMLPAETKSRLTLAFKTLARATLLLLVPVIAFHFISAKWVFDCFGPMRMWFPVNVLMSLVVVFWAAYYGSRAQRLPGFLARRWGLLATVLLVFYWSRHYKQTLSYTRAYDERISALLQMQEAEEVVIVPALPAPDLVVHGDIMEDENDDVNRDFKDTYGLSFKVRKK